MSIATAMGGLGLDSNCEVGFVLFVLRLKGREGNASKLVGSLWVSDFFEIGAGTKS